MWERHEYGIEPVVNIIVIFIFLGRGMLQIHVIDQLLHHILIYILYIKHNKMMK